MPAIYPTSAQPFHSMDLPVELRIQIYEPIVVVGNIFFRAEYSSSEYKAYHRPSLSILRVSKAVHHEAEETYLTENLFVLPSRFHDRMPYTSEEYFKRGECDLIPSPLFSQRGLQMIKHVYVDTSAEYLPVRPSHWIDDDPEFDRMTQRQRFEEVHASASEQLRVEVYNSVNVLSHNMSALTTIQLGFAQVHCPMGCCRNIDCYDSELVQLLSVMKSVRILGLRNQEEQDKFMKSWSEMSDQWHDPDDDSVPEWPNITPGTV